MVRYSKKPPDGFKQELGVLDRCAELGGVKAWLLVGALVNFIACVPVLVLSVVHHLFDVGEWWLDDVGGEAPSRPYLGWTFLAIGVVWGVFMLWVRNQPLQRRIWVKYLMVEKLLAFTAIFVAWRFDATATRMWFVVIVLATDLIWVAIFGWVLQWLNREATTIEPTAAPRTGGSPSARRILWFVGWTTILSAAVLIVIHVSRVVDVWSLDMQPIGPEGVEMSHAEALDRREIWGTQELTSTHAHGPWLWLGMEIIFGFVALQARKRPTERRTAILFPLAVKLIFIAAVLTAQLARTETADPSEEFTALFVTVQGVLAFLLLLAYELAGRSSVAPAPERVPAATETEQRADKEPQAGVAG